MRNPKQLLAAAAVALGLSACSSTGVEQYRNAQPQLDLPTYLNGTLDAWGIFQGRSGEVQKRFHVVIDARWQGDTGMLDEHFQWSDGTTSRRVWTLVKQPDGTFKGTADDVVGTALGEVAGNALRWRYVLALPVDGKVYHVDFDDWMFLMDNKLTSSPPLMAGIPSTGRPCPTASACADSFSKAPTSRTPMRDGELPDISVLGSNCLMAKEEFGTVVATQGSLPPSRPSRPVRSDLGLNPEACRSIWVKRD